MSKARRMFQSRVSLGDDAFALAVSCPPSLHDLCIALRAAIAESVGLSREIIYPEDDLGILHGLMITGWDEVSIVMRLEAHLDVDIDESRLALPSPFKTSPRLFSWKAPQAKTVAEWCLEAAASIAQG